jgi:integrase
MGNNFTPAWIKKGFFNESLFCDDFLSTHQLLYVNGAFFTPEGRVTDTMTLRCEIFDMLRDHKTNSEERTIWDEKTMLAALQTIENPALHLAVHLSMILSLREGEIPGLQPSDLDFDAADGRGTILVNKIMQRANKDALEKLDPNQVYHTFPDRREGSKSSLILKKPKTKKSNRVLYMTKPLKEELLAWLEKLKQDEQNAPEKYSNCGQLFRLPDGLPIAPESKQPAATKITGKEILEAIRLMDAEERRELTRALFAYLFFFLCKGKQAVQAMRRKAPDSGKCANGVQKVCSHFPT